MRDVVVSGGDVANLPIQAAGGVRQPLLDIPNIRDIRLASKGLMGMPQHFLQDDGDGRAGAAGEEGRRARAWTSRVHTHVNHARQLTPLVAKAAEASCSKLASATCATRACCCAG